MHSHFTNNVDTPFIFLCFLFFIYLSKNLSQLVFSQTCFCFLCRCVKIWNVMLDSLTMQVIGKKILHQLLWLFIPRCMHFSTIVAHDSFHSSLDSRSMHFTSTFTISKSILVMNSQLPSSITSCAFMIHASSESSYKYKFQLDSLIPSRLSMSLEVLKHLQITLQMNFGLTFITLTNALLIKEIMFIFYHLFML